MNIRANDLCTHVRKDFIDHQRYISPEFAKLENDKLWCVSWHWACREEELKKIGDYLVYDFADQSVILVLTSNGIEAFHNVCPHRGRRLLSGRGKITKFHCLFHAWQWDLHGNNTRVLDAEQWQGCPNMSAEDVAMARVHVATWAGFVFINLSENPEPFEAFIKPAPRYLDILRMEDMRYCYYKEIKVNCNWKVAQEAFMESYHVWGTHPQFLLNNDEKNYGVAHGKHGKHVWEYELPPGSPSRRLNKTPLTPEELQESYANLMGTTFADQLGFGEGDGQFSSRAMKAASAAARALPKGTPIDKVMEAATLAMKEAAEEEGAYFPMIPKEHLKELGADWNIFPNLGIIPGADGTLIVRARPDPDDYNNPEKCILNMISLIHWGKGKIPPFVIDDVYDWENQKELIPKLFQQDLINMPNVQRGMHSKGLKGLRPNPVQEVQVTNFHKVINHYLFGDDLDQ